MEASSRFLRFSSCKLETRQVMMVRKVEGDGEKGVVATKAKITVKYCICKPSKDGRPEISFDGT